MERGEEGRSGEGRERVGGGREGSENRREREREREWGEIGRRNRRGR